MTDDLIIRAGWESFKQAALLLTYIFFLVGVSFIGGPWLYRKVNGKGDF